MPLHKAPAPFRLMITITGYVAGWSRALYVSCIPYPGTINFARSMVMLYRGLQSFGCINETSLPLTAVTVK